MHSPNILVLKLFLTIMKPIYLVTCLHRYLNVTHSNLGILAVIRKKLVQFDCSWHFIKIFDSYLSIRSAWERIVLALSRHLSIEATFNSCFAVVCYLHIWYPSFVTNYMLMISLSGPPIFEFNCAILQTYNKRLLQCRRSNRLKINLKKITHVFFNHPWKK